VGWGAQFVSIFVVDKYGIHVSVYGMILEYLTLENVQTISGWYTGVAVACYFFGDAEFAEALLWPIWAIKKVLK
jgi:hypothetical protein